MTNTAGANLRVLVIGGGPAGVLTAQALQTQGAKVTVFEQDASIDSRPRDWNFGVYWAQSPLKECLPPKLADQVVNVQVDDHRAGADEVMPIYNGETQELLKESPTPYMMRIARRQFVRLLCTDIDIQYGKRLMKVTSDGHQAKAFFEDGTEAVGDWLIGADGAHSLVRDFLLGPEKAALQPLPLMATGTMVRLPATAAVKFKQFGHRLMILFHPKGYFCYLGVHDAHGESQPGEWSFMMVHTWSSSDSAQDTSTMTDGQIVKEMKAHAEDFGEDFRSILLSIPDDQHCWRWQLSCWAPEPWDNRNGTVTLVGDAAHPMTFHRGQGFNNAVEDIGLLARMVKEHGFRPSALNAYEEIMIPRAREAVMLSKENSLAVHDWHTLMNSPLFKIGLKQK